MLKELGKRIVLLDGAMGTQLQARGLAPGELPETWNLTRPEDVQAIHEAYLAAGADVVTTNTFGANALKYGEDAAAVVRAGVEIARAAVRKAGRGLVALDLGPTGRLLRPYGDLDFADAVALYAQAAQAGRAAGADLALVETMSDAYELKAAVLAAKEAGLPVLATVTLDEAGRLLSGADVQVVAALLEGLGVDAIGLNCGLGPEQMAALFPELLSLTSLPVLIQPNAGLPECVDGCTHFRVGPEEFSAAMAELVRAGLRVAGGCCGTTPEHIRALSAACRDLPALPVVPKHRTWVSSYARTVVFGAKPVLIGERINPTGKPRLKEALRSGDMDYVLRLAIEQQEKGAQVLDVNVGLPEVDEPALLPRTVEELQAVTDLPLQIDTNHPEAMAAAMRCYNGRPLVNSVSGKAESMAAVFPLLKQYGGTAIALTLDEKGIPATAGERVAIAQKIIDTAASYGIPKEDLIFDPLALTISADQSAAAVTLEAVERITRELGCRTSLGVSNVSFGLPRREAVNSAFFLLALEHGLSAAILNPNSAPMTDALRAYCALKGLDPNCQDYIAAMAGETAPAPTPAAPAAGMDLGTAVERGLKESAVAAAQAALNGGKAPMELIDGGLIPALDRVGAAFETGKLYLPQLLMSAEAAKAVFELLRGAMTREGERPAAKAKVVLSTVKGDVHDIGKNIVKVLLENYGYQVVDLGKDVSPRAVTDAVIREHAAFCGLSALMTTTVGAMEETIGLLRREAPWCRVMVGGAVLTEDYAQRMGADFYGKDAMSDVRYADGVTEAG